MLYRTTLPWPQRGPTRSTPTQGVIIEPAIGAEDSPACRVCTVLSVDHIR